MLSRNALNTNKQLARNKSSRKHTQRLRNIEQADVSFKSDLEECTNFMVGGRTRRLNSAVGGARRFQSQRGGASTTILSQVRKYGTQAYVKTKDGVTDDAQNYLPNKTDEFKELSHIYPEKYKKAMEEKNKKKRKRGNRKKESMVMDLTSKDALIVDQAMPEVTEPIRMQAQPTKSVSAFNRQGPQFSSTHRAGSMDTRQKVQVLETGDVTAVKDGPVDLKTAEKASRNNAQLQTGNLTASVAKIFPNEQTQSDPKLLKNNGEVLRSDSGGDVVALQIREKAGSAEFQLNEDSEGAFDLPPNSNRSLPKSQKTNHILDQSVKKMSASKFQKSDSALERNGLLPPQRRRFFGSSKQMQKLEDRKDEMNEILEHVQQENKRLWRLYDNQLDSGKKGQSSPVRASYRTQDNRRSTRQRQGMRTDNREKESDKLPPTEAENRNFDFLNAVKNHTVYRRDKFVNNLSNQIKRNFDPYLKFQVKERKDPIKERPLSSVLKRTGALYPSRDAIARANATDEMLTKSGTSHTVRSQARPGQVRPMSSNFNQLILVRDRQKIDKDLGSAQLGSRTTAIEATSVTQTGPEKSFDGRIVPQPPKGVSRQHQRLQSYQNTNFKRQDVSQADLVKHRPGSGVVQTTQPAFLISNVHHQTNDRTDITSADLAVGHGDDLVNMAKQDMSPNSLSKPIILGVKQSKETETDLFSGNLTATQNMDADQYQTQKSASRPQSVPYSYANVSQPTSDTRRGAETKSTQNLISQLRIKSLRQSKVRVIEDPLSEGHFDVMVDHLTEDQKGWIPTRHTTSRVKFTCRDGLSQQHLAVSLAPSHERLQKDGTNQSDLIELKNDFLEGNCFQLDIRVVQEYGVIKHMNDFLYFSQTRSPIFVYTPRFKTSKSDTILIRFRELLEKGKIEQASSLLELGMKDSQNRDAYKLNTGVTYLLKQQYMEAVQVFRHLSKLYPASATIHSNLLFAYLCDGWHNNVKEFQSTKLFRSIGAPLSAQTQSILELIKYAFSNPDFIVYSRKQRNQSATVASKKTFSGQFSATQVFNSKEFSKGGFLHEDGDEEDDLRINEQSKELEADDESQTTSLEVDGRGGEPEHGPGAQYNYFKKNKKIRDYTKRERIESMGQVLRRKLREDKQAFLAQQVPHGERARTYSPTQKRSNGTFGELPQPDYLELYKSMLLKYHQRDKKKDREGMALFEKLLDKLTKLCCDEEDFQNGIKTKIVKPSDKVNTQETQNEKIMRRKTSRLQNLQRFGMSSQSVTNVVTQGSSEKKNPKEAAPKEENKRDGDVNQLLKVVRKVEEEQMNRMMQQEDEESLDNIFKQLVSLKTTYISESTEDPIEESYMQLVDGLRMFHERYNVRTFIYQYLRMLDDVEISEKIQKMVDASAGTWQIDQELLDKKLSKIELENRFLDQFVCHEEKADRARTFVLSILERREREQIIPLKKLFEDMAYYAEDKQRKLTMDPDRYKRENPFIKVIREFIQIQQELAERTKEIKSVEIVKQMEEQSALNQQYIELCQDVKDLAGRHEETILIKTLGITKAEHAARAELEECVNSQTNKDILGQAPLSRAKLLEHQELYTKGWEKFTYRELTVEQKLKIAQQVSRESDELMRKARERVQREVAERNKRNLSFKAQLAMQRDEDARAFEERRIEENKARKRENLKQALIKKMGIVNRVKAAVHDMQEFEFELINKKLNLDAIEIKQMIPRSHTKQIGLWEDTAALKVIKQRIASINETVMHPEILFEKDEIKLKPLLEKWNNQGQLLQQKTNKSFGTLPTLIKDSLKEDKIKATKNPNLQVRPKIGHEVNDEQLSLIEDSLHKWQEITRQQRQTVDHLLTKNNRFFSIFDGPTRMHMYEHCVVHRHRGKDLEIERDVEETENIRILLRGNIHLVQVNDELDIQLRLASLRAGEVCGDQAIQRRISDPLKILSKERKSARTNTEETITIAIKKTKFMKALFKEMQQELFYKITLLRNTSFFQELSPYSLTIIASNVEVREVKYGEIVVQQGQQPDALYILAHGQCKTLFQYLEQKSTKVSKYANKCLKSDLPKPIHTGMTDYASVPQLALEKHASKQIPQQKNVEGLTIDTNDEELGPQELNEKVTNTLKAHKGVEKKLGTVPKFPLRSFYHGVTKNDKKQMTIQFQNHMVYSKLKVGQAFGMRALLDPLICKKHIVEKKQMFSDNLGINLPQLWDELIRQNQQQLDRLAYEKVQRKEANKRAKKFCKKCFENVNKICTCKLDKLSPEEQKLANKEREEAEGKSQSSFYQEFNESHQYDISSMDNSTQEQPSTISKPKLNKDLSELTMSPERAYEEQRDHVKDQIDQLMNRSDSEPTTNRQKPRHQTVVKRKAVHKDKLRQKIEEQMSNKLYKELMKAQVSITVTSATAKFLVIKKEDKGLLNDYLRVCIDRAILETNFADLDRPEHSHNDVQTAVQKSRGWTSFKEQFIDDIMKETKMQKKANKLLDD